MKQKERIIEPRACLMIMEAIMRFQISKKLRTIKMRVNL